MADRFEALYLGSIFNKKKTPPCCPLVAIQNSDTVTSTGLGTEGDPFIFTAIGGGGGGSVITDDSDTVAFTGDGTSGSPLEASVKISATGGNIIVANADGIYATGGGSSAVSSFNTRTGNVTLSSTDVTTALTFTPEHIFNVKDFGALGDGVTDDTVAIQTAINTAYAVGGGTVFFPEGVYIIGGAIQTAVAGVGGPYDMNAQLYIPVYDGTLADAATVVLRGEGTTSAGNLQSSVFSTTPLGTKGAWLYSTYTGTRSTTHRGTAILGTNGPGSSFGTFNGNCFAVENLGFIVKDNPNGAGPEIGGINARFTVGIRIDNVVVNTDAAGTNRVVATRDVAGIETPDNSGGACYPITNTGADGFKWGFIFGEHVHGHALSAFQCFYGYGFKAGGHDSHYSRIQADWCDTMASTNTPDGTTTPRRLNITNLDVEWGQGNTGTTLYNTTTGIDDTSNLLVGQICFNCVGQGGVGGTNLFVINGGASASIFPIESYSIRADSNQFYRANGNKNGLIAVITQNTNAGTSALTSVQLLNDSTDVIELGLFGSNYTPTGFIIPGQGFLYSNRALFIECGGPIFFSTNNGSSIPFGIATSNQVGIRVWPTITANLHIGAGAATASSAPLKIDSGALMTTPEDGAIENNGTHLYWTNTAGTRFQLDQQTGPLIKYQHTIFTPTTGGTVNIINGYYNIINPAGGLLTLTINLPSSPVNNDTIYIKFTQTISTVTYTGGTVVDGITAPTAGGLTVLVYDSGTNSWY